MASRIAELEAAYLATEYRFHDAHHRGIIRVGEHCEALDSLLRQHAANSWAYVTACNPHSIALRDEENATRMDELRAEICRLALSGYAGEGVDPTGDWSAEASLLIIGISLKDAVEIARRFGQLAILTGTLGQPARLTWTGLAKMSL